MRSLIFVSGVSGWMLSQNGDAEFNNVTVRGDVIASSFATGVAPDDRIVITSADLGELLFFGTAAPDPGLRLRSFLNNAQSQYIGAVEGPDNHPTQGRPHLYFFTDDGSVSATDAAVQLGVIGGATLSAEGDGSMALLNGGTAQINLEADNTILMFTTGSVQIGNTDSFLFLEETNNDVTLQADANTYLFMDSSTGVISLTPANQVEINTDGTESAPALYLNGDTDTGVWRSGSDQFSIVSAGTIKVQVKSSGIALPGLATSASSGQAIHYNTGTTDAYRFTSSRRYKTNFGTPPDGWADQLLAAQVRTFDPIDPTTGLLDAPARDQASRGQRWGRTGFIAEQLAEVFPDAVIHDPDGSPVGVDSEAVLAAVVLLVQERLR
jgi:hypothetical protein